MIDLMDELQVREVDDGEFGDVSLATVRDLIAPFSQAEIHVGLFDKTLPQLADRQFCFAYIDCDLYEATKQCCEFFYPRLAKGAIVLFDDYGSPQFPGASKAVYEMLAHLPAHEHLFVPLPSGTAFLLKLNG